jgi:hypothetical protein
LIWLLTCLDIIMYLTSNNYVDRMFPVISA